MKGKKTMSKVKLYSDYRYSTTYEVTGITSETDEELLEFCDPWCFSGSVVRRGKDAAIVTVYID